MYRRTPQGSDLRPVLRLCEPA